jgi:hypothetical protein
MWFLMTLSPMSLKARGVEDACQTKYTLSHSGPCPDGRGITAVFPVDWEEAILAGVFLLGLCSCSPETLQKEHVAGKWMRDPPSRKTYMSLHLMSALGSLSRYTTLIMLILQMHRR